MDETDEAAAKYARPPLTTYLMQALDLIRFQFPDLAALPASDLAAIATHRFIEMASLIGNTAKCFKMVNTMKSVAGIQEVACLIDFVTDKVQVLQSLGHITQLKDLFVPRSAHTVPSLQTHIVSTPYPVAKNRCGRPGHQGRQGALVLVDAVPGTECIVVTIAFEAPPDYIPGQHVVLLHYGEEETLYFFASISEIDLTTKSIQLVLRMGEWPPIVPLLPTLPIGTPLHIDGGHGDMLLPPVEDLGNITDVVLIAAGTGIAAHRCIIKHLLSLTGWDFTIHLMYSWNIKKYRTVLYHDEFMDLANKGHIRYTALWTGVTQSEQQQLGKSFGSNIQICFERVSEQILRKVITKPKTTLAMVCGMPLMVGQVLIQLQRVGVTSEQVKRETYGIKHPSTCLEEKLLAFNGVSLKANKLPNMRLPSQTAISSVRTVRAHISGVGCRLAGEIKSPPSLWSALMSHQCMITAAGPRRWNRACKDAKLDSPLPGAFIDVSEQINAKSWTEEASLTPLLDVHLRVLLNVVNEALSDAGHPSETCKYQRVGVYTAVEASRMTVPMQTWQISLAIGQTLLVDGPHSNTDAACASGYLAACSAMEAIQNGDCSRAIVAGAALSLSAEPMASMLIQGIFSRTGHVVPLDQGADGTVIGEGCAALVLDVDAQNSYGSVRGWGKSRNFTSMIPGVIDDTKMQRTATNALVAAQLKPADVDFVHLHATGNRNGDVPELENVSEVLTEGRSPGTPLVLLGHKGAFGHTEPTSGVIAMIVTALALNNRFVPGHPAVAHPVKVVQNSPLLDLPFGENRMLSSHRSLSASINANSGSGDYAHLVVSQVMDTRCVDHKMQIQHGIKSDLSILSIVSTSALSLKGSFDSSDQESSEFALSLVGQPAENVQRRITTLVQHHIYDLLGKDVPASAPLMQSGITSHLALKLYSALQHDLQGAVDLPATLIFDYPTAAGIGQMAEELMQNVATPRSSMCVQQIAAE